MVSHETAQMIEVVCDLLDRHQIEPADHLCHQ